MGEGSDARAVDKWGRTPLDVTVFNNSADVVDLMTEQVEKPVYRAASAKNPMGFASRRIS